MFLFSLQSVSLNLKCIKLQLYDINNINSVMNKGHYDISSSHSLYTYNIRIISVKMKVKFQCKMKIQNDSQSITNEVSASDTSTYVFNQQYALVQKDTTQSFTLSVCLVTNKGVKYIAGLAQLYNSQLARAADTGPGSRIVVILSKCLDPEACLQIIVRSSFKNGIRQSTLPQSRFKKTKFEKFHIQQKKMQNSPPLSPRGNSFKVKGPATRSQIYLPRRVKISESVLDKTQRVSKRKSKSKSKNKLNNSYFRQKGSEGMSIPLNSFGFCYTDRELMNYDRIDERNLQKGQQYKDSYLKLKQKLRKQQITNQKQHQKRKSLQQSQANTKIQTLKFRLRCQQLQKNVVDKNTNIKKLQYRIQQLQRLLRNQPIKAINSLTLSRNVHASSAAALYNNGSIKNGTGPSHIKMLTQNNENAITILQNKVNLANQQLQQLKNRIVKINKTHADKQTSFFKQIQDKNKKILLLQSQIAAGGSKHSTKNQQALKTNIQKLNKTIAGFQRQHEEYLRKVSQLEKTNKILQKNLEEYRNKIEQLNRSLNSAAAEKLKLTDQIDIQKNRANMSQFSCSGLKKNLQKLQNDILSMQKFKERYHQSLIQLKKIQGERKLEQKNYENSIKAAQNNSIVTQTRLQEQIQNLNKKNQQLEIKTAHQNSKIRQMETYANTTAKNQLQNLKRLNDKLQRECDEYKSSERISKKQYLVFESRVGQTNSQLQVWRNKHKSLQNVHKLENQRCNNQINRIKQSLEQQMMNQMSLKQKNYTLSNELSMTSGKLALLDEKYSKQVKDLNQKIQAQINRNSRLQDTLKKLQLINLESKEKQKQLINKIQQYGQNQSEFSDIIKRFEQQMVRVKGSLSISQQKLTSKTYQYDQLSKQFKSLTEKYNATLQKGQQTTYELKSTAGQLEKKIKQFEKLQHENSSLKGTIESKDKIIEKQKNSIDQQFKQKSDLKEQLSKTQINLQNSTKQYERFRDHIYQILVRQFTGVDGLDSMGLFTFKNKDNNMTLKNSIMKNGIQMGSHQNNSKVDLRRSLNLYSPPHFFIQQDFKQSKSKYPLSTNSQYPLTQSPSSPVLSNNDIIITINQFSKESKALLSKMIEQYRFLQKEYEYCKQNLHDKQLRHGQQTEKSQLHINKLEQQLTKIFHQKESIQRKLNQNILQLKKQNNNLKTQLQKKMEELDQSVFTWNVIKMDKEAQREFYQTKIKQYQTTVHKIQNNYESLFHKMQRSQQDNSRYKLDNESLLLENRKCKQDIEIKDKKIRQFEYDLNIHSKLLQQASNKNKQLQISLAEVELLLSNEKDKNGKNMQIIAQQEKKLLDTKQFINSLIKQKQVLVKQDILNGSRIIQLQSINMNLSSQVEHLKLKLEDKKSQLLAQKDNLNKTHNSFKQIQMQRNSLKQANIKLTQDKNQKDKEINILNDTIKSKESQYDKQINNKKRQVQQLSDSLQLMKILTSNQTHNYKTQIERLELSIINPLHQQIKKLNSLVHNLQKQLQATSRNLEQKTFEVNSYKEVQQRMNSLRQKQQQDLSGLMDQIRDKDQQLFSISGQMYMLQQKYNEITNVYKLQKQKYEEQFDYKFDGMCEEYETKIDDIEKERDYLKQKLQTAQEQIRRTNQKLKNLQYEEGRERIISNDRLVKIQEEKSSTVSGFKNQLKKIIEEKDKLVGDLKKKNIELQKLKAIQKSDKNTIQKLQIKLRQLQIKIQQIQSQLLSLSQSDKKKDIYLKQYQQSVSNYQWVLQRQIKKELQNVTKSLVSSGMQNSQTKKKVAELVKEVENKMSRLISQKIAVNTNKTN